VILVLLLTQGFYATSVEWVQVFVGSVTVARVLDALNKHPWEAGAHWALLGYCVTACAACLLFIAFAKAAAALSVVVRPAHVAACACIPRSCLAGVYHTL